MTPTAEMLGKVPGELGEALRAGYTAITEGVGDARKADYLYNRVLPEIYRDMFSRESLDRAYALARGKDAPLEAVVSTRPEFADEAGNPLTVRFTRNNVHPQYVETVNSIVYPIIPYLVHSKFRLSEESKVRGRPQYLDEADDLSFKEFLMQMRKAWNENTAGAYDMTSIRDGLMHELTHWYDYNFARNTIFRKEKHYPRQDRDYVSLMAREAAGGKVDKSYYEWKDANLHPVYRGARMAKEDADILARGRGWTHRDLMNEVNRVRSIVHENERMGRPSWEGVPDKDKDMLQRFDKYANRYNFAGYHASAGELNARVVEQIPWLVDMRMKHGKLPMKETLQKMVDRAFDLPPEESKFTEMRNVMKALALPGALRSVARRCCKLIDDVNHMECPPGTPAGDMIGILVGEMAKSEQKTRDWL